MSDAPLTPFCEGMLAREQPGPGEKVLWVHGYTMDSSTWGEIWGELPQWHHIGVDLPGHGGSAPLANYRSVSQIARLIGARALELGVRHVVGLSFGGMVAVQIALEYPDAFASFSLGSPALIGGPKAARAGQLYWELGELYKQRGAGPWMTGLWMQWPPEIFKGAAGHPALWDRLRAVIDRHTWQELPGDAIGQVMAKTPPQTIGRLQHIATPALVLIGDDEMASYRLTATLIQAAIPGCGFAIVPGAGHLCMLETPAEAAALIAAHMRAHAEAPLAAA